jgi:phage gpG-like protein
MLTIEVQLDATLAKLRKMAAAIAPEERELINEKIGVQLHGEVMRTFESEGATEGRPRWQDLARKGRQRYVTGSDGKRRLGEFQTDYKILQDTGALRQSYFPLFDKDSAGVGAVSGAKHADLAPLHEFGVPARNLPARPMLPEPEYVLGVATTLYGMAIRRSME